MIRQAAFAGKGSFLKGNLHCHTTRSDGRATPETVIRQYAAMGYDFLALTDHNRYNYQNFAPETGVLILPGMELDAALPGPGIHCVHVVSVGPERGNGFAQDQRFRYPAVQRAGEAQAMVDDILAAGNLPLYCHPEWSGTPAREIQELKDFSLMEIWNSGCVIENGLDANAAYWDELLCAGRRIYGAATDDGHHLAHNGHGFVRVRAEKNPESILTALAAGAFYASCGPEIEDFFVDDEGIATVICSPASVVRFRHFRVPYQEVHGSGLTGAQVSVWKGTGYIRAEVVDTQGRRAWTNPIFLDQADIKAWQ